MKVLLVNPPDTDGSMFFPDVARTGRYSNHPPYGLGIVSSRVKERGHTVSFLNLNHEVLSRQDHDTWAYLLSFELERFQPDVVGVSCLCSMKAGSAMDVCRLVRGRSKAVLTVGGAYFTSAIRGGLEVPEVDVAFLGESEDVFCEFLAGNVTGKVLEGPRPTNIDVIPDHEGMRTAELSKFGSVSGYTALTGGKKIGTVLSTRGCRGRCAYCSVRGLYGEGVRHRSVDSVLAELRILKGLGIGHWMWIDDDLLNDHKRAITLFNAIKDERLDMTWDASNGVVAGSCTPEVIRAAVDSGCIGLHIGVESGNDAILRAAHKPATVSQNRQAAKVLLEYPQVNTRGFLMVGFPGETYRMMLDTMYLALDMDLDWWNVNIMQYLPNTEYGVDADNDVRFSSGPYGMKVKANTDSPFKGVDLDSIPPVEHLAKICGYVSYRVNYHRLMYVRNEIKLAQISKYLDYITAVIAPDDPVPHYYAQLLRGERNVNLRIG